MSITKPPVLPAWADTAVPTTDIVQPANSFITAGWPSSSTPPSRQYFNWVLNFVANGIRYFCRRGVPDWDSAELYSANDIVRGQAGDGPIYRSLSDENIGNVPESSPTKWGSLTTVSPATNDNSDKIANTQWVQTRVASFTLPGGTYPSMSVGFATNAGFAATAGSASSAGSVPWAGVAGHPTTVAGYGISDAITTAGGQAINGGLTINGGDLVAYRAGGTTGVVYLRSDQGAFIYYDGVNFQMEGGSLLVNNLAIASQSYVVASFLQIASAAATYLSQAAAASTYLTQQNASTTYVAKSQIHIAADPGTVPTGSPGDVFEYY